MGTLLLENITKRYGNNTVVSNANISVSKNEFVTIVGPSGCGKTTILRMIAGFIEPSEGRITLDNDEIVNTSKKVAVPPEKRGIGMVFQSYAVWPHMNVFDNVSYPLRIRKVNKNVIKEKTMEVLKIVHLEPYVHRFPYELSGGQQQRVALARALVMEPRLLLLDEPLSNLDAKLREQMRFEIKQIQQKMGVTIINVTHDQIEAMTMSDKVVVMNSGHVIQIGSPEEIYNHPVNSFVAKFIGSANIVPCRRLDQSSSPGKMTVEALGVRIEVPLKETKQKEGLLAVRPHHIFPNQDSPLKAKVIGKLYQGDRIDYMLQVQDQQLSWITDASEEHQYQVDDVIGIEIKKSVWLDD